MNIDASQMPVQRWTIVAQPSLLSPAASSLGRTPRPLESSLTSSADAPAQKSGQSLEDKLFGNAVELKMAVAQVTMHLEPQWREVIFRQLDTLLNPTNWEEGDSALIEKSTFMTFLRFILYAVPTRLPSLGVSHSGHILAAWSAADNRVNVEFLPDDKAAASCLRQGTHSPEILVWKGNVADLKSFVIRNDMLECILGATVHGPL